MSDPTTEQDATGQPEEKCIGGAICAGYASLRIRVAELEKERREEYESYQRLLRKCTDHVAVRPEGRKADWWASCKNTECPHHYGEGYFQEIPSWVVSREHCILRVATKQNPVHQAPGVPTPSADRMSVDEALAHLDRVIPDRGDPTTGTAFEVLRAYVADTTSTIDTAWKAYPSHGAVRGMVSLAEVVETLVLVRSDLGAQLTAATEKLIEIRKILN